MIVATAGHVDHGKTLLVRQLTGVDTDRLPEEQARGMTIELGFAYRDLGDGSLTGFVDVPGHERFIRTMVAGVSGIDVVLFVVAADDGPMPQTAEHLAILDLLGVERGVIALSKCDRVAPDRVSAVTAEVRALLAGTALTQCPIVPVSALTGYGIEELRGALLTARADLPAREQSGAFRLAVDRSFVIKGAGRVVTGTVFAGQVAVGDSVHHAPGGGELRVRGLHAQNREATMAYAGQRCALNVAGAGVRDGDIARGDWIVAGSAHFSSRRIDARVRVVAGEARALANRTPVHVHIGAADSTGRLITYDGRAIAPGESALVQILLDHELHAVRGDRVVLRDQSARRTLGGGEVVDPLPDIRGRRRSERLAYLDALTANATTTALGAALDALPDGLDLQRFQRSFNLTDADAAALWRDAGIVVYGAANVARGVTQARWHALELDVCAALGDYHAAEPGSAGASSIDLVRRLPIKYSRPLLDACLDDLVGRGVIGRAGGLLHLPGYEPKRDPREEALWRRVYPLLAVPDARVPVVHDMLAPLKLAQPELERFLAAAARQGRIIKVSAKRYFLPDMIERFTAVVHDLARDNTDGRFGAAAFRDRAGIGRNAAIEILEYFDRIGLTRRQGEVRVVLNAGRSARGASINPTESSGQHAEE